MAITHHDKTERLWARTALLILKSSFELNDLQLFAYLLEGG
jgi:hypothetical protein